MNLPTTTRVLKQQAHSAVKRAIKNGGLKRQPCEVCGSTTTQAHHHDYTKPLEVNWLCRPHHRLVHKNDPRRSHPRGPSRLNLRRLNSWPDAAQRIDWAKILKINPSTLYRADKDKRLRGSKPGGRTVVYTKKAILKWLGIELESGK